MPHPQKLLPQAKAFARRQQIMSLVRDGHDLPAIASKLGCTVEAVRRNIHKSLSCESKYPSELSSAQTSHLRSIECEMIDRRDTKLTAAMNKAVMDSLEAATPEERSMAANAAASCHRSLTGSAERRAKLLGLDIPSSVRVEQWTFSMRRQEQKITISFDASPLQGPLQDVPGMTSYSGGKMVYDGGRVLANGAEPVSQLPGVETSSNQPSNQLPSGYTEIVQRGWDMPAAMPVGSGITVEPVTEPHDGRFERPVKSEPAKPEPVAPTVTPTSTQWKGMVLNHGGPPVQ
jgi:hypothetical protein